MTYVNQFIPGLQETPSGHSGVRTPFGQNVRKVGKTFLELGKKIYSCLHAKNMYIEYVDMCFFSVNICMKLM